MDNMNELNLNELENAVGGVGGYSREPAEKPGYFIYRIKKGENLTVIARQFGTTVNAIVKANPPITDPDFIVNGYYIYIPE